MTYSTPVKHDPCITQRTHTSGISYADVHDHPCTTLPPGEGAIFKLYSITPSRLIAEYVQGVVGCGIMIVDVFITYQI